MGSSNRLTDINSKDNNSSLLLTTRRSCLFKMSIEYALDNGYNFKKLNSKALKELHSFIDETVGKKLTISQVEALFLRTKGDPISKEIVNGAERSVIHFGKEKTKFRIHGYYNNDSNYYFVICKIDPNHKVHSS